MSIEDSDGHIGTTDSSMLRLLTICGLSFTMLSILSCQEGPVEVGPYVRSQSQAATMLVQLGVAQSKFKMEKRKDANENGKPEYGSIEDLSVVLTGIETGENNDLLVGDILSTGKPSALAYKISVFLPAYSEDGELEPSKTGAGRGRSVTIQEEKFCAIAVPYKKTSRSLHVFAMTESGKLLMSRRVINELVSSGNASAYSHKLAKQLFKGIPINSEWSAINTKDGESMIRAIARKHAGIHP